MIACMKRALIISIVSFAAAAAAWVQITSAQVPAAGTTDISGERIRAHVKFLASDLLEGRGPGTRGGDLATEYIATQFALAGLKPAGDHGTYFQQVPLIGIATEPSATLSAQKGGQALDLRWESEFVGVNERLTAED